MSDWLSYTDAQMDNFPTILKPMHHRDHHDPTGPSGDRTELNRLTILEALCVCVIYVPKIAWLMSVAAEA